MRRLLVLPLFILASCGACKTVNGFTFKSPCPDDGKCSIEVINNKSLEILTDEIGADYYQLLENKNSSVIHYEYKRNTVKGLQDGSYVEEVFFEVNNETKSLSLVDAQLQNVKLIYGRLCYCKGQTGYYKVSNGKLKFKRKAKTIEIELNFNNYKVPQIIQKVSAVIK